MFSYEFMKEFKYKRGLRIFYFLLCCVNIGFLISVLADNSPLYKLSFTATFAGSTGEETVVISRYLKSYKYNDDSEGITDAGYGVVTHGTDATPLADLDAEIDCDGPGHLSEPIEFPSLDATTRTACGNAHLCSICQSYTTSPTCPTDECDWGAAGPCLPKTLDGGALSEANCDTELKKKECHTCDSAATDSKCAVAGSVNGHKCEWDSSDDTCKDGDIEDPHNYCDKQIDYITTYAIVAIAFSGCLIALVITQEYYDGKAVDEAKGLPVMLMVLTQALHGAALALGLAFYVALDESSDSYMVTNFMALGSSPSHSEDYRAGTVFLAYVYFSIVGLTVLHAIHIINLFKQKKEENWLGYHNLYANFM